MEQWNANASHEEDIEITMKDPYLIRPLFVHHNHNHNPKRNRIRNNKQEQTHTTIVHSIVTPIPLIFRNCNSNRDNHGTGTGGNDGSGNTSGNRHSPCDPANVGEIQIAIEETNPSQSHSITRRITVRSYGNLSHTIPDTSIDADPNNNNTAKKHKHARKADAGGEGLGELHASFALPIMPLPISHLNGKKDWICWADFGNKTFLCVLTEPNKLRIFDVYPDHSSDGDGGSDGKSSGGSVADGGEGHSVSLPFEASGIFPLDGLKPGGLLIQRQCHPNPVHVDVPIDFMVQGANVNANVSHAQGQGPPFTLQLGTSNSKKFQPRLSPKRDVDVDVNVGLSPASSYSGDLDIDRMISSHERGGGGVDEYGYVNVSGEDSLPTLYTLHNPLEEPRYCRWNHPTTTTTTSPSALNPPTSTAFCNASERIIFVGKPRCFLKRLSDVLVVTYNEHKKCHNVWVLKEAPPPAKSVPLWKLTSRKLNRNDDGSRVQTPMSTSESASPLSDLHAMVSMTCIHTIEVGGLENEATTVFLATTTRGTGDFILCLLIPTDTDTDGNKCILQCIEFDPLGEGKKYADANVDGRSSWDVVKDFQLPCRSALPVEATKINLRSMSIQPNIEGDTIPQRIFLKQEFGKVDPGSLDILLCGIDGNLDLYRGNIHIVDIDAPFANPSSSKSQRLIAKHLSNAVCNQVDINCGDEHSVQRMRIRCSLSGTRSLVADAVLSSIGSALLETSLREKDDRSLELYFALRADWLKLVQCRSLIQANQYKCDDIEWDSLSLLLCYFIALANGCKVDASSLNSASTEVDIGTDNAWESLLQTDYHSRYVQKHNNKISLNAASSTEKESRGLTNQELACLSECKCIKWISEQGGNAADVTVQLFDAVHMLHEDLMVKNGPKSFTHASMLADLLYSLCQKSEVGGDLLMEDFMQHYVRSIPSLSIATEGVLANLQTSIPKRLSNFRRPPCFNSWLEAIMMRGGSNSSSDLECFDEKLELNGICFSSGALLRFYLIFFSRSASSSTSETDRRVISAIAAEGFHSSLDLTNMYSSILLLPLLDAMHRCRLDPPPLASDFSIGALELIGRNDLAQIKVNCKPSCVKESPLISSSFRDDDPEHDGLVSIEKYSAMLFPNDTRVREAARMLRSSRPLFLRVPRSPEVNDHDFERLKQQKLALLCRRLLPLPVGRGMITIGTMGFVPMEPMVMPKICLAGRMPPQNVILALEDNRCTSKHKMWPDFHNGVAAGLRLPRAKSGTSSLSRTFIVSNKPKQQPTPSTQPNQQTNTPEPDYTYGGFLLALGLRGHLSALTNTDICDYINDGPVTTAVGLMIGLAANKRGSCDITIQKTMMVHIPSLLPTSFRSIDLPSSVQTAAVAGVGLLCQASSHRLLTEFLLNEMGKRPDIDQNTDDRESYTLCCGISLGMVNLCLMDGSKRTVNDGLADLNIEERLHRYIVGGVDENITTRGNASSDRANGSGNADNEKCSRIYEGGRINTDITAPGATLALGMIFHRSGSKSAASLVALPDTVFALDCVRPDFLFLRIVSRSLILWDEVEPTIEWIESQMPEVVSYYFNKFRKKAERVSGLEGLATFAAMSMSGDGGLKDVEMKGDKSPAEGESSNVDSNPEPSMTEEMDMNVDYNSIRQAHAYITAGLCLSLGLRFAGTGDERASEVIYSRIIELRKLRDGIDSVSTALRPDMPTVELCLGSAAISLSMVMAGTGDLKVLRLLKSLRWKCDMDVKYGNHMAYASAIGLLFLGGGTCTLGNEPADIAALLISFFPRYPIFTHDNRYHLQALRHLYALAIKERKIEAIDVDSNEKILLPMSFDFDGRGPEDLMTPHILLNKGASCKIRVSSDRYFPAEITLKDISSCDSTLSIFVKRKSGRLSYAQDPHGLRSFFLQVEGVNGMALDFVRSFIENPKLVAYSKYMCNNKSMMSTEKESHIVATLKNTFERFCTDVLQESLKEEKTESILTHLALFNAVSNIEKKSWLSKIIWELRLLRSFYQSSDKFELVEPHFVALLCETIDKLFCKGEAFESVLGTNSDDSGKEWTGPYSIWYNAI